MKWTRIKQNLKSNLLEMKSGHLKIGIPTIINIRKLINLISRFHESYPNVTFQLSVIFY